MDKLIKHAMDGDAVNFVDRMKSKLGDVLKTGRDAVKRNVAATMAGTEPMVDKTDDQGVDTASAEDTEV